MANESERFATIYAQGRPIGFLITRVMGFEIFDVDEKPLAFVYSQRKGIEILQRRDIGKTRPPGGGRISHAIMHLEIVEVDRQLTRRYVASVPHCWVV